MSKFSPDNFPEINRGNSRSRVRVNLAFWRWRFSMLWNIGRSQSAKQPISAYGGVKSAIFLNVPFFNSVGVGRFPLSESVGGIPTQARRRGERLVRV
jgi:hypothetical protein